MQVVETRMLEGPNIFLLSPAVKIEFDVTGDRLTEAQAIDRILRCAELVKAIHDRVGLRRTNVAVEALETPGHIALIYGWERRAFAVHCSNGQNNRCAQTMKTLNPRSSSALNSYESRLRTTTVRRWFETWIAGR